jgi:hypothetical protein
MPLIPMAGRDFMTIQFAATPTLDPSLLWGGIKGGGAERPIDCEAQS